MVVGAGLACLKGGVPYYFHATHGDLLRTVKKIGRAFALPVMVQST